MYKGRLEKSVEMPIPSSLRTTLEDFGRRLSRIEIALRNGGRPAADDESFAFGEVGLFSAQALSVVVTIALAVVGTLACVCVVRLLGDMRVSARDERVGLDVTQHGERAYPSFNGLDD